MSHHHVSRREFVTSLGLGIAGLSIGGEARAEGRRSTSCATSQELVFTQSAALNEHLKRLCRTSQ